MLTATATETMAICSGKTNGGGKSLPRKKTVETPIVIHKTERAVIFVFNVSPLPSL